MANKVPRTIYFSEEMDRVIDQRMKIVSRTRSAEVERLIQKALRYEAEQNEAAVPD